MTIYATFKAIQVAFNAINLNVHFTNLSIDCIVDLFVIFVDFYIDVFINFIKNCSIVVSNSSFNIIIDYCIVIIDSCFDVLIDNSVVISDCSVDIISNHCVIGFNLSIDCIFHISDCCANLTFQFLDIIFVSTNTCRVIYNIVMQVV